MNISKTKAALRVQNNSLAARAPYRQPHLQALSTAAHGGRRQQVRHPFVVRAVTCPSLRVGVIAVVFHRQVGAVIDEKPHGVLVPLNRGFMKYARRLVRTPVSIDVCAAMEEGGL